MNPLCEAYSDAIQAASLAYQTIARGRARGNVPEAEIEELRETVLKAKRSLAVVFLELVNAKRDDRPVRWINHSGRLAHEIAIRYAEDVLLHASFVDPKWEDIAMNDTNELEDHIHLEHMRAAPIEWTEWKTVAEWLRELGISRSKWKRDIQNMTHERDGHNVRIATGDYRKIPKRTK